MQTLKVKFFGLSIYKEPLKYFTGMYTNNERRWVNRIYKTYKDRFTYHCYIVIDFGKATKKPVCLWGGRYKRKTVMQDILDVCNNANKALLLSKGTKDKVIVLRNLINFKMKFFGMEKMPIQYITKVEYENRYRYMQNAKNITMDF